MSGKTQTHKQPATTQAPQQPAFQGRPFASEAEQERAAQLGHSFSAVGAQRPALVVQPKLKLGPAKDKYEEEADRVAAQVAGAPAKRVSNQLLVQRMATAPTAGVAVPASVEAGIAAARGAGQPLPESVRERMEGAMGADFGGVRLHTGAPANKLNWAIGARAFTTGQDIFFRQGEYDTGSATGRQLLAHELMHVVQQNDRFSTLQCVSTPPQKRRKVDDSTNSNTDEMDEDQQTNVELVSALPPGLSAQITTSQGEGQDTAFGAENSDMELSQQFIQSQPRPQQTQQGQQGIFILQLVKQYVDDETLSVLGQVSDELRKSALPLLVARYLEVMPENWLQLSDNMHLFVHSLIRKTRAALNANQGELGFDPQFVKVGGTFLKSIIWVMLQPCRLAPEKFSLPMMTEMVTMVIKSYTNQDKLLAPVDNKEWKSPIEEKGKSIVFLIKNNLQEVEPWMIKVTDVIRHWKKLHANKYERRTSKNNMDRRAAKVNNSDRNCAAVARVRGSNTDIVAHNVSAVKSTAKQYKDVGREYIKLHEGSGTPPMHCELQITNKYQPWELEYIGIYQWCCLMCNAGLQAMGFDAYAGSHGTWFKGQVPNQIKGSAVYLDRFLGPEVFNWYLDLSKQEREFFIFLLSQQAKFMETKIIKDRLQDDEDKQTQKDLLKKPFTQNDFAG